MIKTSINDFYIRFAEEKDCSLILKYIKALADHEAESDWVTATEATLRQALFVNRDADVILGIYQDAAVGFAVFHKSFSTYSAKPGIHLVDFFVEPEMRGNGFGKAMLSYLADLTVEKNSGRFEWWAHKRNGPTIAKYEKWGACPVDDIRVYRLSGDSLRDFSHFYKSKSDD